MNKKSLCLFGGALIGAGLSSSAIADLTIIDSLNMVYSENSFDANGYGYSYNQGGVLIHTIDFTVNSSNDVIFDVLSWGIFDAFIDIQIMVFHNNGNPLSMSNYIDGNNDHLLGDTNGSINVADSYLELFLTAGEYTIAIGGQSFDVFDADFGLSNSIIFAPPPFGIPGSGQYQLDIIGNVTPTPGVLALLSLGGLFGCRRER